MVLAGAVALALTALAFYPGYHTGDSNWQYWQVRSGIRSDWHSPVMTWIWSVLDRVVEGTGGMFLLHAGLFWAGWALAWRTLCRRPAAYLAACWAPLLFPPVLLMLAQLSKDTGFGAALLLGFALLLQTERRPSAATLLGAAASFVYALTLRRNAIAAVLPLALWMGFLLARHPRTAGLAHTLASPGRRALAGGAVALGLFGAAQLATSLALGPDGRRSHLEQVLFAYDLTGISVRSGRSLLPDVFRPGEPPFGLQELATLYHPRTGYTLFWGPREQRRLLPVDPATNWIEPLDPARVRTLRDAWLRAFRTEPRAYLSHRFELFLAHLALGREPGIRSVIPPGARDYTYRGANVFDLPHHRAVLAYIAAWERSVWMKPWLYLAAALAAWGLAWRRGRPARGALAALVASSLLYALGFLPIGVNAEYRYFWWCVLAGILAPALAAAGRPSEAATRPAPERRERPAAPATHQSKGCGS